MSTDTPLPTVRDLYAARAFVELLIGWTAVGSDSDGNEVSRPTSPQVRAHLEAMLGNRTPGTVYGRNVDHPDFVALAAYLRSVADAINPAGAPSRDEVVKSMMEVTHLAGLIQWTAPDEAAAVERATALLKTILRGEAVDAP